MKISFSARSENEAFARACVSSFVSQLDPYVSELAELKTAVSEAVTNAVVHGYRGVRGGVIYMHIKLFADRRVYIKIRDKGCGIEDIALAMQPLYTTAPEEERAGLGRYGKLHRQTQGKKLARQGHGSCHGKDLAGEN